MNPIDSAARRPEGLPLSQGMRPRLRALLVLLLGLGFLLTFAAPVLARPVAPALITNIPLHLEFVPNDPDYNLPPYGQWGLQKIDAPRAWDVTLGSPNITVAVVDTGVWYTEQDIAPNMWTNTDGTHGYNYVNNTEYPMDSDYTKGVYHGTGVAGVIAATINNGIEIAGVANVKIMAVEALGSNGEGSSANTSKAITYAADHGARIINLSLGTNSTPVGPTDIETAINYAWSKGALVVAAAGNGINGIGQPSLDYPASLPNVVSVGSIGMSGTKSTFSNYANGLSLTAPGENILTLDGGGYPPHDLDGTSLATPFVSGVAALLLSLKPSLTNVQLWNILNQTALPPTGGYTAQYGWGVVNAWNGINQLGEPFISVNSPPSTVSKGSAFSLAWSILGPSGLAVTDTHVQWGTNAASLGNTTTIQTGVTGDNFTAASLQMPSTATNLYFQVVATVNATRYASRVYTVAASNLPNFLFVLYQFLSSNLLYLAIFILALAAIVAFVPQRRARARRAAAYRARAAPPPYRYPAPPPGPPPGPPANAPAQTVSTRAVQPPPPLEFTRPAAPAAPPPTPVAPAAQAPVATKKRCPNCGTLVNSENMFCFFCGHPFR